ncbi:MAG: hypothetical protein H0X49_20375 [Acidobacteria bacterium]|nr:hypothetical protein [Acidobacteriota bacterium]
MRRHFEETILHPRRVLQLYLIRNGVVHGSKIGIASKSEYQSLLRLTNETLDYFIKLINKRNLKRQTEVLDFLIKSDYTTELLQWLKMFPDENSVGIVKAFEEELNTTKEN